MITKNTSAHSLYVREHLVALALMGSSKVHYEMTPSYITELVRNAILIADEAIKQLNEKEKAEDAN